VSAVRLRLPVIAITVTVTIFVFLVVVLIFFLLFWVICFAHTYLLINRLGEALAKVNSVRKWGIPWVAPLKSHHRGMKVEKEKLGAVLTKLIKAKPVPRTSAKATEKRGPKISIISRG
jgi:hypothetical protein